MQKLLKSKKVRILIYSLLVSVCCIFICSKNSPLYCFNDWVDENAFMTMGKGWAHGLIPYKDLFEQKGPFLYLIFMIGYLISNNSFFGIFILEIISLTVSLYLLSKIIQLYLKDKYIFIILPLFASIITTSVFFSHGGSAEEFSLPYFIYGFYILLKYFKEHKITDRQVFLTGLCAGIISMIKFNILGFYIGFCFSIGLNLLLTKQVNELIKKTLLFLLGMFIPVLIFVFYFILNNALREFIDAYIRFNTGNYTYKMSFIKRVIKDFYIFFRLSLKDKIVFVSLFVGLIYFLVNIINNRRDKVLFLITFILSFFGLFFGGFSFDYYFLIMIPYALLGFIVLFRVIVERKDLTKEKYRIFLLITIIFSFSFLFTSANFSYRKTKKEDLVQYKFSKIINETKNHTILNFRKLDYGFYMMADVLPTTRYFERQNAYMPDYYKKLEVMITNREFDYVIDIRTVEDTKTPKYITNNYTLVTTGNQLFEGVNIYHYLYKKK